MFVLLLMEKMSLDKKLIYILLIKLRIAINSANKTSVYMDTGVNIDILNRALRNN